MRVAALAVAVAMTGGCSDGARPSASTAQAAAPALPPAVSARWFKLEALSEWGGKQWAAVAELNLLDGSGDVVDRKRWTASASSADVHDLPANAIDGDPRTLWHSRWQGAVAPLPHALTVDMGATLKLSGMRYLPRQEATENGAIAQYRLFVSADGKTWGEPLASGDFRAAGTAGQEKTVWFAERTPNRPPVLPPLQAQSTPFGQAASLTIAAADADDDLLTYSADGLPHGLALAPATGVISGTPIATGSHTVQLKATDAKGLMATAALQWTVQPPAPPAGLAPPAAGEVRFVKLEEISEVNGKPWASIAEFNLLDKSGKVLPRDGWVASADSAAASDRPENAIDGNPASIWHTQWDGVSPPPPHSFIVDMRRYAAVGGFSVLPRQDKLSNGVIARWRFFTSVDGVDWGDAVAQGDFTVQGKLEAEKTVRLRPGRP